MMVSTTMAIRITRIRIKIAINYNLKTYNDRM